MQPIDCRAMVQVIDKPDLRTQSGRLRHARMLKHSSMRAAANAFGWNENTYKSHEQGIRRDGALSEDDAKKYARAFGISVTWLLTGRGDPQTGESEMVPTKATVPLVGYVGAGAEAHFYASGDEGLGEVDAPPDATPLTRAAEIRGESLGPLFDSWLVYYDEVRTPVTPDQIGRLCIVGLPNDKVLVKKIQRSRTQGLYHLLSNNEAPMLDQEVVWAARVKTMTPR